MGGSSDVSKFNVIEPEFFVFKNFWLIETLRVPDFESARFAQLYSQLLKLCAFPLRVWRASSDILHFYGR